MDSKRPTMKYLVATALVVLAACTVLLHITQYGQIRALETRLEKFEKDTAQGMLTNLAMLERTLARQDILEQFIRHSQDIRLAFELIKDYNISVKTSRGAKNETIPEILRAELLRTCPPLGTGGGP
jgi:hypothetical protein